MHRVQYELWNHTKQVSKDNFFHGPYGLLATIRNGIDLKVVIEIRINGIATLLEQTSYIDME